MQPETLFQAAHSTEFPHDKRKQSLVLQHSNGGGDCGRVFQPAQRRAASQNASRRCQEKSGTRRQAATIRRSTAHRIRTRRRSTVAVVFRLPLLGAADKPAHIATISNAA